MIRDGYVVTWQGREYEAVPDGDDVRIYSTEAAPGFDEIKPGRFRRVLPDGDFDDLVYVRTACTWREAPFVVLGQADGWLRVEYTGGRAPIAKQLGLEEFDFGVYQGWAPVDEVTDLHEQRI